jgi:small nuclear ribonucleoprotein (snRNP)-like protein
MTRFSFETPALVSALYLGASASSLAAAAYVSLSPSVAFAAESAPPDAVMLKDGTEVRGTLITVDTGNKVIILEAGSDKTRTIPWKDVADIEKGKYAKVATKPSAAAGFKNGKDNKAEASESEPASTDTTKPGVIRLHIETPTAVRVVKQRNVGNVYSGGYMMSVAQNTSVCANACDKVIDTTDGDQYYVGGDDFDPQPLKVGLMHGDVRAKVDTGNAAGRTLGSIGLLGGTLGLLTGGTVWLVGAVGSPTDPEAIKSKESLASTGMVVVGVSAAVVITSIVAKILSAQHLELQPSTAPTSGKAEARKARYWAGEF